MDNDHPMLSNEILRNIIKLQEINNNGTYYVDDNLQIIYKEDISKKSPEDICIHKIGNKYYRYCIMTTTFTKEHLKKVLKCDNVDDHPQLGTHTYYLCSGQIDENGNDIKC